MYTCDCKCTDIVSFFTGKKWKYFKQTKLRVHDTMYDLVILYILNKIKYYKKTSSQADIANRFEFVIAMLYP